MAKRAPEADFNQNDDAPPEDVFDDEEGESNESPEEVEAAPPPPPAAKRPQPPPKRKTRSDLGKPHAPPNSSYENVSREAEQRWAAVLDSIQKQGKSAYDVGIRVSRMGPPMQTLPGYIDGAVVMGSASESPGDMLREKVIDYYHESLARGPQQYKIQFFYKTTGKIITDGMLSLPAPEEIHAFRQKRIELDRRAVGVAPSSGGVGAPPTEQWQQPRFPVPMSAGYSPAPVPQGDDGGIRAEMAQMRAALAQAQSMNARMLDELIAAAREGRAPQVPIGLGAPQGAPTAPPMGPPIAPQGTPYSDNNIEAAILRVLDRVGLRPGVGAPNVPTAPAPTPRAAAAQTSESLDGLEAMITNVTRMKKAFHALGSVLGEGEEEEPPPAANPTVEAPKPEDNLPFDVVPVPEASLFDKPVQYARDKETGAISYEGLAFANPQVAEKLMELGGKLVEGLGALAKGMRGGRPGIGRPPEGPAPAQMPAYEGPPPNGSPNGAANGVPPGEGGWPT